MGRPGLGLAGAALLALLAPDLTASAGTTGARAASAEAGGKGPGKKGGGKKGGGKKGPGKKGGGKKGPGKKGPGKKGSGKKGGGKKGGGEQDIVRITALGGLGGGRLELYDSESKDATDEDFEAAASRAVGVGPGAVVYLAVPVSPPEKGTNGQISAVIDFRGSSTRYAQASTIASLAGSNAGTGSSFVHDGASVSPTYQVTVYGRGVGIGGSLKRFEFFVTGGMMRGVVQTTIRGQSRESDVRGMYFAATPGYRLGLSKNVHLLAMAEMLLQPTGLIADSPGDAFPLSDQLAIPTSQLTGLVGLRVDL